MKRTKTSLLKSALALLLCVSMLIGSTFAWFTDKVTSKGNIIQSGNLDIEMYWTDDLNSGNWYNVEEDAYNTIFSYDKWEPGCTDVKYIKLVNKGDLAMNYKLTLTPQGSVGKLAEVINVFFADKAVDVQSREDLSKLGAIGLLNNVLNGGATANGTLLAKDQYSPLHPSGEVIMTIAMNMITTAGNDYQDQDSGEFTITALATQAAFEKDSFGSDYDSNAEYPTIITGGTVTTQVNAVDGKVPAEGVNISGNGISAFVPGGIEMADGADSLTLSVTPMEHTTTDITVVNNEILIPVDVHISGIAAGNTTPIVIDLGEVLPKYLNMGNYHLFHVENGANSVMTMVSSEAELTEHNRFTYDPLTGAVKVAMASFSEVALVAETDAPWEGNYDYKWYDEASTELTIANADQLAAFGAIVGGMAAGIERDSFAEKTVKLLSDINMGDKEGEGSDTFVFYPIGYYNNKGETNRPGNAVGLDGVESTVYSFEGIFDGNGHTIKNIYQNTWEMFGDYNSGYSGTPNYYKDAMGLFGYVVNGTVKNLTVNNFSSDGEFTPTGVIAAYAVNSTFENIAITNCNPRVYNTGNGGIIGIAGRENEATEAIKLRNITVDKTNKISALWGSWDVACGGLVGMYRGNADNSGDTISFENCHVAAQIDVYNDVCANYQYYAYRYAGMIIGSIRHNSTNEQGKTIPNMTGISATGCTVNYGKWNEYYYCEFEKNSMASYSEDYQFSRVDKSEIIFEDGKAVGCTHDHTQAEDKRAVYLPFYQLFTGYSWGVSSIGLREYSGIVTELGITENESISESVQKFDKQDNAPVTYRPGQTITIGELFKEINALVPVVNSSVYVSISPATESDIVSGTYAADKNDWTKGTITFANNCKGAAMIIITDYYYCNVTVMILNAEQASQKFTANPVDAQNAYTQITLGELFSGKNVQKDVNVTVTAPNGKETTINATASDWSNKTIDLTAYGEWTIVIKENDEYCEATEAKITVNNVNKFNKKFTQNFLYRVGNANTVKLNSLFSEISTELSLSDVYIDILNVKGDASGSYTPNSTWTNGTIQFSGTGVVNVIISAPGANSVELQLEVVDAYNATSYNGTDKLQNRNSVLLNNIEMTSGSSFYLSNATLYGNGFTFDCTKGAYSGTKDVSSNYILGLTDAHLDNVTITGAVYTEYGGMASLDYNRALVLCQGNSSITNCYLSNTASPVRLNKGNLTIKGSTLKGGNFANIDIRNGHLTLEDVTTINQALGNDKAADNSTVVGLGIVGYYEAITDASITVKGTLKQYNHISSNDQFSHTYANQLVSEMLGSNYTDLQYKDDNNTTWANAGIVLMMANNFKKPDKIDGYTGKSIRFSAQDGYIFAVVPTAESIVSVPSGYCSIGQGAIAPSYNFDYTTKNYIAKTEGSNDYCYYDNGKVLISMDQGDTFNWDPFIFTANKYGNTLGYTVSLNGNTYASSQKIAFNASGDYVVTYTYTDSNNYVLEDGKLTAKAITYTQTVAVNVSVIKPSAKNADFTFKSGTATEKVTVGNNTYIVPAGVSSNNEAWGYITVSGTKIFYPIVEARITKNLTGKVTAYFDVFSGVVTITDYQNSGTGNAITHSSSMPSNLSVVKGYYGSYSSASSAVMDDSKLAQSGPENTFKYYASSTASSTPTTNDSKLCFASPSNLNTSGRGESITVAQYKYVDNAGATYYYYVGYHMQNAADVSGGGCVTPDTLVTMADGSKKQIQDVRVGDMVMAWNFATGKYEVVPVSLLQAHETGILNVLYLQFEDGTVLKVLGEHGVFDVDLNTFTFIDEDDVENYVGHKFVKADGDSFKTVKLVDYEVIAEHTTAYTILSTTHYNVMLEDMFTVTPAHVGDNFFNPFDINEDMIYDAEKMAEDIAKYGLYTYEDFAYVVTYEEFVALNLAQFKISVEKGYVTYEGLIYLLQTFVTNPDYNIN